MRLFLVVQNEGKQKGMRIPVTGELFLVGRDPECQLRPASSIISKKHCGFSCLGKEFFLEDYKSTNGTLVNGSPIEGKVLLKVDDHVTIGPLDFKVQIEPKPTPGSGMMPALTPPAQASNGPKSGVVAVPSASQSAQKNTAPAPAPAQAPKAAPQAVPPVSASAAPTAAQVATASKNALDDDIAALLLGGDESPSGVQEITGEGTTVVDLSKDLSSTPPSGNPAVKPATAGKPIASTTDAAKALLEKYMRRPRAT